MRTMLVAMTEPITVLVVDDDPEIRSSLQSLLEAAGYLVESAADGREALEKVAATSPDLLVADVLMPLMDGLGLCRMLRAAGNTVPILLLTARSDVADCVAGLDAGADDYLSKPFDPHELLARLRAMARRTAHLPQRPAMYHGLELVPEAHAVRQNGRWIDFSSTEYAILCVLAENPEQALSRSQISDAVWGYAMTRPPTHWRSTSATCAGNSKLRASHGSSRLFAASDTGWPHRDAEVADDPGHRSGHHPHCFSVRGTGVRLGGSRAAHNEDLSLRRESDRIIQLIQTDPNWQGFSQCTWVRSPACAQIVAPTPAEDPDAGDGPALPITGQMREVASGGSAAFFTEATIGEDPIRVYVRPLPNQRALVVGVRDDRVLASFERLGWLLAATVLGALVVAAGTAYVAARRGLRPVDRLTAVAEGIAQTGDTHIRIPRSNTTEINGSASPSTRCSANWSNPAASRNS